MTTSKTSIRCKLVVDDKIIHQEGKFKYLDTEMLRRRLRNQATRAMRAAAQFGGTNTYRRISKKTLMDMKRSDNIR